MRLRRWRSSWWARAGALFAAAWLAVALGGPLALYAGSARGGAARDPMHREMSGMAGAMRAMDGMRDCGGPTADVSASHAPHDRGSHQHACCTCFGSCCHAAPVVPARAPHAPLVAAPLVTALRPRRPAVVVSYRPTAPEHARPPSVGPPPVSTT